MSSDPIPQPRPLVPRDLADILPHNEFQWDHDLGAHHGPCPLCGESASITPEQLGHSFTCRSQCDEDEIRAALVEARARESRNAAKAAAEHRWPMFRASAAAFVAEAATAAMWVPVDVGAVAKCGKGGTATAGRDVKTFRQTCRRFDCGRCAGYKVGGDRGGEAFPEHSYRAAYRSMSPPLFGDDDTPVYWQVIRHRQDPDDPPEVVARYRTERERFLDRAKAARGRSGAEWTWARTFDGLTHVITETNLHAGDEFDKEKRNRFPVWELSRSDARRLWLEVIVVQMYLEAKPSAADGSAWALCPDKKRGHTGRKKVGNIWNGNLGPIIDARTNEALDRKLGDSKARLSPALVAKIAAPLYKHHHAVVQEEETMAALEAGTFDAWSAG